MAKKESKTALVLKGTRFEKVFPVLTYKHGPEFSILFSYLYSQQVYFEEEGTIGRNGFFFKRYEEMAAWCGMTPSKVRRLIPLLEKENLICSKKGKGRGNNIKEYKVNPEVVLDIYHNYNIKEELPKKAKKYLEMRDNRVRRYQEKSSKSEEYLAFMEHQEYMFNQENEKI